MHFAKWFATQDQHGAIMRLKRAAGLSYNTVHAIITGKRPPNRASAQAISAATGGKVSADEVFAISEQGRPIRRVPAKRKTTRRAKVTKRARTVKSKKAAA